MIKKVTREEAIDYLEWARPKEGNDMSAEKSNVPKFEWICPCCGGKEYDANSLCLDCGARMISREVTENECKGN